MPQPNNNIHQYQHYFASGYYDRRYPAPNRTVMARARQLLPEGGRVLDYGCGSGRYLLPLRDKASRCIGYDICPTALQLLEQQLQAADTLRSTTLLGPDESHILDYCRREGPVDTVLCLFGVLSHIDSPAQRQHILRLLRRTLSTNGHLLISVPNKRRRFRREQRARGDHDQIRYTRNCDGRTLELGYHLYDVAGFRRELMDAGFEVIRLQAESLFPEAWVSHSALLARGDCHICRWLPAALGYGLLAVARPWPGEGNDGSH